MSAPAGSVDFTAVRGPTEAARGLPNACYVSDAHFAAERDRLFARSWSCVGVGSDLPNAGDQRPVNLMGWPLLLARAQDGHVRVFHNVCSHRGATLIDAPCNAPTIRCPYHSWAYDLGGRLLRTPDFGGPGIDGVAGLPKSEMGLREVRSDRWLDFIFVNLDGKAEPLDDWLQPLKRHWSHYALDRLRHGGALDFTVRANWKLATENTMEYYHLPWVHRSLNSYSPTHAHYHCNAGDRFVGTATHDYRPAPTARPLPQFPDLTEAQRLVGEYPVVFPNLWLGVQVDHVFAMVVYPMAPALTAERLHLYFVGDAAMTVDYAAARAEIIERWRAINAEDIGITERLQAGRASPGFDGGRLSPVQDFASHHFMRRVADLMTAAD